MKIVKSTWINVGSSLIFVHGSHLHHLNCTLCIGRSWLSSIWEPVVFKSDGGRARNAGQAVRLKKNGYKMLTPRISWNPRAQHKGNEDKTKPISILVSPELGGVNILLQIWFFVMEINIHLEKLMDCKEINFCCFSHQVCGNFLYQLL